MRSNEICLTKLTFEFESWTSSLLKYQTLTDVKVVMIERHFCLVFDRLCLVVISLIVSCLIVDWFDVCLFVFVWC